MADFASPRPSSPSSRPPLIRGSTDPQPAMHASSALLDASNHPSLPRPRSAIPGQAAAVVKKALSSDEFVRRTKRGEQELGDDEGGKRRYVSAGEGVGAKKGEDKATETGQAHQQHQQRVPTSRPTSPVAHLHARVPRSSLNVAASRSSNTGTSQAGSSSSGAPSSASSSLTPKPRSRSRLPLVLPPDASHISTPSSTPLPSPSSDTRPRSSLFLSLSLGPIPPCVTPTEVVACGGEAGGRALEAQVQETDLQMQLVGGNHTPAPEKTLPSPLASPRNRVPLALTPTEQDRPESRPQQSRRPSSLAPMSTSRPLSSLQVPESSLPSPALSGSSSTNSFISADYTGLACPVPVRPSRISLAMQKSASAGAIPGRRRASGRSPDSTSPPRHHDAGDCDESKRPPIATFTSFEEAFGLSAPLSPPPSPPPPEPTPPPQQQASKSWWPL